MAEEVLTTEEGTRWRSHTGWLKQTEKWVIIAMLVMGILFMTDVHSRLGMLVYIEQYLGLFLGFVLVLTFIMVPYSKKERTHKARPNRVPWWDIVLAILSAAVCLYVVVNWPDIANTAGILTWERVTLGILAVLLMLETCRRFYGWFLVGITIFFLFYALMGQYFPEPFTAKSIPWNRLATLLYLDKSSLFGTATEISGTVIVAFIIFGSLMVASGAGKFLIDMALSVFGRFAGGVAKTPVVASALFGSISGLAVANIYATGSVTIPMMKKYGVEPHVAGAIEACAATGGIILPPVMGVVAFIMAVFLNMTYAAVCIAAAMPALLYYLAIYVQVDRYAAKSGFGSIPRSEVPSFWGTLKDGWIFFLPVVILVITLFVLYMKPEVCAMMSALAFVVIGMLRFKAKNRLTWRLLIEAMENGGKGVIELTAVCGLIGILIGAFMFTGLGFALTHIIFTVAQGNIFIILLLSAVLCIILGCGLPQVTIYVIVALLIGPLLTELAGIPALASHMFIFYYTLAGFLTPPFMMSVYAASNLAGADMMKTAGRSLRLSIVCYTLPFAFAYDYALLAMGSPVQIAMSFVSVCAGTIIAAIGMEGYMFGRMINWPTRIVMIIAGFATYFPMWEFRVAGDGVGILILLALFLLHLRRKAAQLKVTSGSSA